MKVVWRILKSATISVAIYFAIALGLVVSQGPTDLSGAGGLDFSETTENPIESVTKTTPYTARDGTALQQRIYRSTAQNPPLLILLHGSGWHGLQFDALARRLSDVATVVVPDLRGHGFDPVRRGDVDYIGQLEDDISDLITKHSRAGQKVILAGHSSGGGLVVRFAGGRHGALIDRAILLAPFLKYNAPTTRPNSGGWAQPLTRRIIGLTMLNALKITRLNDRTVIQFNFPQTVLDGPLGATATAAYSHRLNTSFAPRNDFLADIAALPEFLLIVGTADEAFVASEFQPVMSAANPNGRYKLVKGVSHLGIVDAPQSLQAIEEFIAEIGG